MDALKRDISVSVDLAHDRWQRNGSIRECLDDVCVYLEKRKYDELQILDIVENVVTVLNSKP